MIVKPFRGLRPRADLTDRLPSLPYDVVSAEQARETARHEPDSFLHVIRAEADLDPGVDPHDDRVYARARENFLAMVEDGRLERDATPAYYIYRLSVDGRSQVGVLGAAAVEDYVAGRIKKHEHTRPEKVEDRIRVNLALGACPGPVFLTYRPDPTLDGLIAEITSTAAPIDFEREPVRHELWVCDDPTLLDRLEAAFASLPATYVADGHHRAAAAAQVAGRTGAASFLAAHFPANQLEILDYNRVVHDLGGLDAASLLARLETDFVVQGEHAGRRPGSRGQFGLYLGAGSWSLLTARDGITPDDPVRGLDVSVLTDRVLQPILGLGDLRTDTRIGFVGGIGGMEALETAVDQDGAAAAFAVYPTRLDDVLSVADAGEVMPPKSTWFEPKLLSGMVVQLLE